jgi:hypothetical protein
MSPGRRMSDNEIIARYREMQTNPNWRVRLSRLVIPRLPRPIAERVIDAMERHYYKIAMRDYTQADWDACRDHVQRMRGFK